MKPFDHKAFGRPLPASGAPPESQVPLRFALYIRNREQSRHKTLDEAKTAGSLLYLQGMGTEEGVLTITDWDTSEEWIAFISEKNNVKALKWGGA